MSTTGDTLDNPSNSSGDDSRGTIEKPVVAVTVGDPAGIGPEVVLKALSSGEIQKVCDPIIIGDRKLLEKTANAIGLEADFRYVEFENFRETSALPGTALMDLDNVPAGLPFGEENALAGKASGQYIEKAVQACREGYADAIATAPINKRSFNAGGYDYPGHTEFIAHLTSSEEFSMSFFADRLRVVLLSTHISLAEAIGRVKREPLSALIRFTDRELGNLLGRKVKIAVAGLNPHASEGGMFGNEEAKEIGPAVTECSERYGIEVSGPYSPDTIFIRGFDGEFDAVIACYHDQATIAVKCLSFGKGVNVTLGLPIIRTSVDHGTGYDIAGRNMADPGSLISAVTLASELAKTRMVNSIIP